MAIDHIKDVVNVMRRREKSTYYNNQKNKQAVCCNRNEDAAISATNRHYLDVPGGQFFRQVIIQWMYNMANTFRFSHQVVIVANYYLDTMVQYKTPATSTTPEQRLIVNSVDYQLASLTSIYVAMKVYGSRVFPVTELIKLGRDQFSIEDVLNMEGILVNDVLQWKLTPPTVLCYISEFDKLYKLSVQEQEEDVVNDDDNDGCCSLIEECSTATKELEEDADEENAVTSAAIKLVQNVIYDDEYCMYPPSIIACAAMILAIKQQEPQQHQQRLVNEAFLSELKYVMNLSSREDVKVLENALKLLDPSTTSSTSGATTGKYLSDNMETTSTTSRSSTVASSNSGRSKMLKKEDGEQHCCRRRNNEVVIVNQVEAMKTATSTTNKDQEQRSYLKRGFDSTGTLTEQGEDEDEPQESMISPTSVNGQR